MYNLDRFATPLLCNSRPRTPLFACWAETAHAYACSVCSPRGLARPHNALSATRAAATVTPVQHAVQLRRVQRAAPVLPRSYLAMSHSLTMAMQNEPTRYQNATDATRCVEAHLTAPTAMVASETQINVELL